MIVKVCVHITSNCPCLSKFSIVSMVMVTLTGRMDLEPILPVKEANLCRGRGWPYVEKDLQSILPVKIHWHNVELLKRVVMVRFIKKFQAYYCIWKLTSTRYGVEIFLEYRFPANILNVIIHQNWSNMLSLKQYYKIQSPNTKDTYHERYFLPWIHCYLQSFLF